MTHKPYLIAFDADDTLWDHESYFVDTRNQIAAILAPYIDSSALEEELYEVEKENLKIFGYGVKGFTISVIQTAIEVSKGKVDSARIYKIITQGKELMRHPIQLRPFVQETLKSLAAKHPLTLITKGDLFHQEYKIEASGVAKYFQNIEIVGEKEPNTYLSLLAKYRVEPERFLMIGNSLRSDVIAALEIGGNGIHIPSGYVWAHDEVEEALVNKYNFTELQDMADCINTVEEWFSSIEKTKA